MDVLSALPIENLHHFPIFAPVRDLIVFVDGRVFLKPSGCVRFYLLAVGILNQFVPLLESAFYS